MTLDEMMRRTNFNNITRDNLVEICHTLQEQVKLLQSINNQKIDRDYYTINKLQNELNTITEKYNKTKKTQSLLFNKLSIPLTLKERWSGKLDISKINRPDNE